MPRPRGRRELRVVGGTAGQPVLLTFTSKGWGEAKPGGNVGRTLDFIRRSGKPREGFSWGTDVSLVPVEQDGLEEVLE